MLDGECADKPQLKMGPHLFKVFSGVFGRFPVCQNQINLLMGCTTFCTGSPNSSKGQIRTCAADAFHSQNA